MESPDSTLLHKKPIPHPENNGTMKKKQLNVYHDIRQE